MTHDTCCPVARRVLVPELSDELDRVEAGILGERCCEVEREQSVGGCQWRFLSAEWHYTSERDFRKEESFCSGSVGGQRTHRG